MARAFSIARALVKGGNATIEGKVDLGDFTITNRFGDSSEIEPWSLCYNTGLVDRAGRDVFEGDYITTAGESVKKLVVFDDESASFVTSYTTTIVETEVGGDERRYCQYPNATVIQRFDAVIARNSFVSGFVFDFVWLDAVEPATEHPFINDGGM